MAVFQVTETHEDHYKMKNIIETFASSSNNSENVYLNLESFFVKKPNRCFGDYSRKTKLKNQKHLVEDIAATACPFFVRNIKVK